MNRSTVMMISSLFAAGCGTSDLSSELVGTWDSSTCEAYPAGNGNMTYLERNFTITSAPDNWTLKVIIYADSACTTPFVEEDVGDSTYTVVGSSSAVAGAEEVDYNFAYRKLMPLSDAATSTLDQTPMCGTSWTTNVEQDLSTTGCPTFGVDTITSCPTEHDLNKVTGTNLFYGDRSGDLCNSRPITLGTHPVVKR